MPLAVCKRSSLRHVSSEPQQLSIMSDQRHRRRAVIAEVPPNLGKSLFLLLTPWVASRQDVLWPPLICVEWSPSHSNSCVFLQVLPTATAIREQRHFTGYAATRIQPLRRCGTPCPFHVPTVLRSRAYLALTCQTMLFLSDPWPSPEIRATSG